MPQPQFVVDITLLGRGATGVQLYALECARYLERSFFCRVLAPEHLASHFIDPLVCGDPLGIKNSIVARGRMSRAARALLRDDNTFVYCPYMRGFLRRANQVITIHDLIAHYYPTRNAVERIFAEYLLPRLARRVKGVFTVSATAGREVARFYGVPAHHVHVVPSGLDPLKWRPAASPPDRPEPYLLVVSANRRYKNTVELLQHYRLWADRYALKIVSTRARYGNVIRSAVREYGLEQKVEFLDDLSNEELIELYRRCTAVVYPSLMEGFGRPALEGMAVGRPVILSDIAVHKELFGEAAIFITPGDAASWERAFHELTDALSLQRRIRKGFGIARRFTLENSYKQLTDALLAVEPALGLLRKENTSERQMSHGPMAGPPLG
jgi:glycosyltransferase involved in cell wall biosynthesis